MKITYYGHSCFVAEINGKNLLNVVHDAVEPIRKKRIVLDGWPGHETRQQVSLALVEDLIVDDVKRVSDVISSGHDLVFEVPVSSSAAAASSASTFTSSSRAIFSAFAFA